jgi:hypothetical protein
MIDNAVTRSMAWAILLCITTSSPVRAASSYLFQVTNSGLVSTLDVDNVTQPVGTYQITGLNSSDLVNAASFDPNTNRLYYVNNLSQSNQSQLDYVQLNAQGGVVSQNTIGILPSQVNDSLGADFYEGRVWVSQNNTNMVYGFDPNHLSSGPITLTLPTPAGSNAQLSLGDLTFNDSSHIMFIAGNLNGTNFPAFIYEYSLSSADTPTLIASRIYTNNSSDPRFNGVIFNQGTDILYGYNNTTGQLYTIDTSTLTIASDLGSNPALFQGGDLAGFSPIGIAVPEPSSIVCLSAGLVFVIVCRLMARVR